MAYIGSSPTKVVSRQSANIFTYTATANQTAFTGSDANGNTLACTPSDIMVHMNGIKLEESDYTATTTTVTLGSGAAVGDEVTITAFVTFESADHYNKSTADTRYVNTSGDTMTGALTVDADGATPLTVDRATSNGTLVDFQKDGSSVGSISTASELSFNTTTGYASLKVNSEGDGLQYSNVGTRHFGPWLSKDNAVDLGRSNGRFKDLYLGGGAYIGGNGSANYLDDYEEGTWTPTVGAVTGQTQPTVTTQNAFTGAYVKIGKIVHAVFYCGPFQFNSTGASSALAVRGFPFNHSGADSPNGDVTLTYYISWSRPNYVGLRPYSTNDFGFLSVNNGANWGWEPCSAAGTGGSRYISGSITYYTNS